MLVSWVLALATTKCDGRKSVVDDGVGVGDGVGDGNDEGVGKASVTAMMKASVRAMVAASLAAAAVVYIYIYICIHVFPPTPPGSRGCKGLSGNPRLSPHSTQIGVPGCTSIST